MTLEQNKALVRRFYTAFEANDLDALNVLLAPDLSAWSHGAPGPGNREVHLQVIRNWHATFGETRFAIEDQIAEGDLVATRLTMHAIHSQGDFQGMPPTGRRIAVPAITIERIVNGAIASRRVSSDWFGMLQQLGLIPPA